MDKCILCGGPLNDPYGHNPAPLASMDEGRACGDCNATKVIPARLGSYPIEEQE